MTRGVFLNFNRMPLIPRHPMAAVELQQDAHRAGEWFPRPAPHQPFNHPVWNFGVPPAAPNGQFEGRMDAMVHDQQVGGVAAPEELHDPQHADIPYGMIDYHPQPLRYASVPYEYPDVRFAQGIQAQERPNALENQDHNFLDYIPQQIPPLLAEAAAPGQPAAENLRRLAIRYVHHPASQVDLVSMQPGAAGHCRVVIVLEMVDIL